MKPEDPFAEQEASFQPTCTAEVCNKYMPGSSFTQKIMHKS